MKQRRLAKLYFEFHEEFSQAQNNAEFRINMYIPQPPQRMSNGFSFMVINN